MKTLIFSLLVLLITCVSCCKDEPNESPKFEYIENFEDSLELRSWILKNSFITNDNSASGGQKFMSKVLVIEVISCHGAIPCETDSGYASKLITNLEGKKILNLSASLQCGRMTLIQMRNGNLIKSMTNQNCDSLNSEGVTDTFNILKDDILQLILSNKYSGAISGPMCGYFDNIELIEK